MSLLKFIAIYFFDLIDKYIHQKKIVKFLKLSKIRIKIFVDVGAHKGLYTDLMNNNFIINKILMFEPQLKIFTLLKKKYKKQKKISIYNSALSNKNSIMSLNLNHHDLTSSLSELDRNNVYLKYKAKLFGTNSKNMVYKNIKIKTIKLYDVLSSRKINQIDLLKIDTEGHELQVLEGLKSKIGKVKCILIEFHNDRIYLNYSPKKIHSHLIKNNFILKESFKFPFTTWEDRVYLNKKYK